MTALLQLCQSLLMEQILAMFEIDLIAVEEATKPHLHFFNAVVLMEIVLDVGILEHD